MISLKSYSTQLVEHFNHPQNVGHFDENDPTVGTGRAGCVESGDCVRVQIKIRGDLIEDICFKAQGSCATIAVASWLSSKIKNKTLEYSQALTPESVLTALELPSVKKHSVLLVLDALNKALKPFLNR
jgi:nitrogen fixation NifU-like protein